ncbi:MAG: polyprenyl synthetase family protein [Candidatus Aminicenantes bacterium]|nr:polyprenyl synthetase family protein [Candidatus Aminicenantes bacterium]MDH5743177.1 polyprenyl synthetase family protein [Candidatus Aminicenantes bacterium]
MREINNLLDKSQIKKIPGIKKLYHNIRKDLEDVEENLKLFTKSPNKIISEISTYLFQNTGKRIRPALLILCAKLRGYTGKEHIIMSSLVETIHTASLLHDDIIDNSKVRRGRESVHARWGPNITVLLGDYLYIKTIGYSLQSQHRQIVQILTDISAKMIEGELNEYYVSWNLDIGENDYLDIINKKTASLFSASCRIGGILGMASAEEENILAEFGTNLGLTFQIVDDLLDYTGDERTMGKPVLSDLREGRITLPLIYTLNNDGKENRKRVMNLLKEKELNETSLDEILDIVRSNGALDYTQRKAQEYSVYSKMLIQKMPPSIYRDGLSLFPDYILYRNK